MTKCAVPRCQRPDHISFLGVSLCSRHWDQLCAEDEAGKHNIRKLIGVQSYADSLKEVRWADER